MKTLLVVGASSDVGLALIESIADTYEVIWAHYLHWNDNLEKLKTQYESKIRFVRADLFSVDDLDRMISEIKDSGELPSHIVHFPMTKIIAQNFAKTAWESFDDGWNISVRSAVMISQAFLPSMKKQKSGKIIFMLSSVTSNAPPKYESSYVTVKYAMLGLMKSLAAEYEGSGICINGVSPDMIQTKFLSELPRLLIEQYAQTRPQKSILSVGSIIPTIEFLLFYNGDSINGENICIK